MAEEKKKSFLDGIWSIFVSNSNKSAHTYDEKGNKIEAHGSDGEDAANNLIKILSKMFAIILTMITIGYVSFKYCL